MEAIKSTWEIISLDEIPLYTIDDKVTHTASQETTYRMKVFGGWLVKNRYERYVENNGIAVGAIENIVFVKDENHEWESEITFKFDGEEICYD